MRPDEPTRSAGTVRIPEQGTEPARPADAVLVPPPPDTAATEQPRSGAPAHLTPADSPDALPDRTPAADVDSAPPAELLNGQDVERFRGRLRELQADFVDDPARAVRDAKQLLGEAMTTLSEAVAERGRVPDPGDDTEDLRVALRRYRSTLDRLLAI
ncbi:hypothetical protein [Actinophytocola sediminis]